MQRIESEFDRSVCVEDGKLCFTDESYDRLVKQVDMSKSPGAPLSAVYNTNGEAFDKAGLEIRERVNHILQQQYAIGQAAYERFESDPESLYRDFGFNATFEQYVSNCALLLSKGITSPSACLRKGELRKTGEHIDGVLKPTGKYPRLIVSVSVEDTLLARGIYGDFLVEEQAYPDQPTAVALDLTTPFNTRAFFELISRNERIVASDVQGWDFSTSPRDYLVSVLGYAVRMGLTDADFKVLDPSKRIHLYALLGRSIAVYHRVVSLKSGKLVVTPPGMTSSGEFLTFSKNSFTRAFMSFRAHKALHPGRPFFVKTMGDDCLDSNDHDDLVAWYAGQGVKITHVEKFEGTFSFCSTTFTSECSYQENIEKSVASRLFKGLSTLEELIEADRAFELSFGNHPEYATYKRIVDGATPAHLRQIEHLPS